MFTVACTISLAACPSLSLYPFFIEGLTTVLFLQLQNKLCGKAWLQLSLHGCELVVHLVRILGDEQTELLPELVLRLALLRDKLVL